MKKVIIFEDGKSARGQSAKLIKRGNKRVLIEFLHYDDKDEEIVITEWFKLFIPSYSRDKKPSKHNNQRHQASYCHEMSNLFYSDYWQTEEYKEEVKEYFAKEYYDELFEA